MNRKLNISYYTAKKMLMELLANDKLLEDEDIKEMLKDMALQKGKTDTCFKDTPIVIDTQCRLFFPIYSEKEVKIIIRKSKCSRVSKRKVHFTKRSV